MWIIMWIIIKITEKVINLISNARRNWTMNWPLENNHGRERVIFQRDSLSSKLFIIQCIHSNTKELHRGLNFYKITRKYLSTYEHK